MPVATSAMTIELRKLSNIKPYSGNPRGNDGAVEAVAANLKEFGWRQPIVVDTDGVIIVGHTRWKAAQKLGLEKAPSTSLSCCASKNSRARRPSV